MLKQCLAENGIPEMKRPEDEGKRGDQKDCAYHRLRLIENPTNQCRILIKHKIQDLIDAKWLFDSSTHGNWKRPPASSW